MTEKILDIGSLKKLIKDLPDDLPIECEVHKLSNTYIINKAYRCINAVEEPILCFEIKTDWNLTERDEKALNECCK